VTRCGAEEFARQSTDADGAPGPIRNAGIGGEAMGLMDKVKSQAATATAKAKDAAQKGQAKLDDIQAKRAADAMLHDLGALVYGERTGRTPGTVAAKEDRLVQSLRAYEQEHGLLDLGDGIAG
jgi:hypothetical protein